MKLNAEAIRRTERAIRCIRQRIFDLPEHKQAKATEAIGTLKARLPRTPHSPNYHWQYAAE